VLANQVGGAGDVDGLGIEYSATAYIRVLTAESPRVQVYGFGKAPKVRSRVLGHIDTS
jgi:hypothetical protein